MSYDTEKSANEILIMNKLENVTKQLNELKNSCNSFQVSQTTPELQVKTPSNIFVDEEDTSDQHQS